MTNVLFYIFFPTGRTYASFQGNDYFFSAGHTYASFQGKEEEEEEEEEEEAGCRVKLLTELTQFTCSTACRKANGRSFPPRRSHRIDSSMRAISIIETIPDPLLCENTTN